jgi:xanthine dehydrogenase small subunit
MRDSLYLYINGEPVTVYGRDAFRTVSDFLRRIRGATGTKIVCEEGDCGACTVLVGRVAGEQVVYRPVNSCIQHVFQLDGAHLVTVEGVRSNGELSAVQQSMVDLHGAQCGFCTPGFVTALTALFEENSSPSDCDVRDALTGNLCRCTGYEPIINAALAVDPARSQPLSARYPDGPLLRDLVTRDVGTVCIRDGDRVFLSATTLEEAIAFRAAHPECTIIQGGTDVGVWCNKSGFSPEAILNLSQIPELKEIQTDDEVVSVGGSVTLLELESFFRERVPQFYDMLHLFGSPQIRAVATLAGNVVNGSPIADTLPFLYVMGAEVELAGPSGRRRTPVADFYRGYKTLDMDLDEIVSRIIIPLPRPEEVLRLYKVSKRRDLDISTFTAAILLSETAGVVDRARVAYGGVGPTVIRLRRTEQVLCGQALSEDLLAMAGRTAREEITPISDVRGSADFRLQLAENILLKFYHEHRSSGVTA